MVCTLSFVCKHLFSFWDQKRERKQDLFIPASLSGRYTNPAIRPKICSTFGLRVDRRGGRKGGPKYAKKPQTASDFFLNTETARTRRNADVIMMG